MPHPKQPQGLHKGFKVRPQQAEAPPTGFLALQEGANALVIVARLIEAFHQVAVIRAPFMWSPCCIFSVWCAMSAWPDLALEWHLQVADPEKLVTPLPATTSL